MRVNADHGCDFHRLVDHMTKLRNFTKGEIHEFSVFPFSLQLIVQWILGRFDFFRKMNSK